MTHHTFTHCPENTKEAVRLLLVYMRLPHDGPTYAIYREALKDAQRLLGIYGDPEAKDGSRQEWLLPCNWATRLKLAGLNPDDSREVTNRDNWDLAWQQLRETATFRIDVQQRAIATGKKAPRAEGEVKSFILPLKEKSSEMTIKDLMPREMRRKFGH
jgi:hypothetical protein